MVNRLNDRDVLELTKELVIDQDIITSGKADSLIGENKKTCRKIQSDGSTRRFWRIYNKDEGLIVVVAPDEINRQNLAEAAATWKIGTHLRKKNIPVPELYARDKDTGILLFEDLGDVKFHKVWTEKNPHNEPQICEKLLGQVVEKLAQMQFEGIKGFDNNWCWDTPVYDYSLMVEKESKYFLGAFWQDLLGQQERPGVLIELEDIAHQAEKAPTGYLLHRDFQSRNIMVQDGKPIFIDFQGARTGPLGYDLASLLIDPYTQFSEDMQDKMMNLYLEYGNKYQRIDRNSFFIHYIFLAMQRNLQIIGAFAFLYKVRGKNFFRQFLKPALYSLRNRLNAQYLCTYKNLRLLVDDSLKLLS